MLKLPKPVQRRLASEFRFAADKMADSPDLPTELYFFSVFYGELHRMLNQSWSRELSLAHQTLKTAYESINARIMAPTPEGVRIPAELPDALHRVADELASIFTRKEIDDAQLFQVLTRAAELASVVSGNGFYLYLKGEIRIGGDMTTALPPPAGRSRTGAASRASRRVKGRP